MHEDNNKIHKNTNREYRSVKTFISYENEFLSKFLIFSVSVIMRNDMPARLLI